MNSIDWSNLRHAYGTASDVPRLLAALASDDESDRDGGFYDFFGSLCHQGTVYPASLAAIPALLALLAEPSYPDRERMLEALVALANGYGDDVEMADVRRALAQGSTVFLRDNTSDEELVQALSIVTGPEFADAADEIERVARDAASAHVRTQAWPALAAVAPQCVSDEIAAPIMAMVIRHTCPVDTLAFHPHLTAAEFDTIARDRGHRPACRTPRCRTTRSSGSSRSSSASTRLASPRCGIRTRRRSPWARPASRSRRSRWPAASAP